MRAARIDANQPVIVFALRNIGAKVQPLHTVGSGVPDVLVCFRGKLTLLEIKDSAQPPSARRLTPPEARWHAEWQDAPLYIVSTVLEAYKAIGAEVST